MARDLAGTRAFFAERAAAWDVRFAEDAPQYERVAKELPLSGAAVLDAGCGTGRALPHLRAAVGERGALIAVDVTPEMLDVARPVAAAAGATLVMADVMALPLRDGAVGAVFAAGLVPHFEDAVTGLRELARVTREGGLLAVFHAIGRATLAARHGSAPSDDHVLAPATLPGLLRAAGWRLEAIDDADDRYLTVATRAG